MFKIGVFVCCCITALAACTSHAQVSPATLTEQNTHMAAQQAAPQQLPDFHDMLYSPQQKPPLAAGAAARLLSELAQAVEVYDIHKALALFAAIDEAHISISDDKLRATARSSINPLLDLISLEQLSKPAPSTAGAAFDQPFTIRAVVRTPKERFPLAHYPLKVSYPSGIKGSMKTKTVYTDSEGVLNFTPPVPEQATDSIVHFYLSLSHKDSTPVDIPDNLCAVFPYKVATREKQIPTIIAILDYDENNQPVLSTNITAARLLTGLIKRGFSKMGLDEYEELAESDEMGLIHAAQIKIGSVIDRFIFGKTTLELKQIDQGTLSCSIQADISVWDFKHMQKTKHLTFEYTATAKTKDQAIFLARTALGESIIAEALIYQL